MFGTVEFVSKGRLQKDIYKWDSLYSFSSYRPFLYTGNDPFITYNCLI